MANDKNKDINKYPRMKNEELLNPNKDTQEERLARGPRGVPKDGQTYAELNKKGREDIKKPQLFYDAMKGKEDIKEKDKQKEIVKDSDHDKNKD